MQYQVLSLLKNLEVPKRITI